MHKKILWCSTDGGWSHTTGLGWRCTTLCQDHKGLSGVITLARQKHLSSFLTWKEINWQEPLYIMMVGVYLDSVLKHEKLAGQKFGKSTKGGGLANLSRVTSIAMYGY